MKEFRRTSVISTRSMTNATPTNEAFLEAYDAYADAIFRHCYFRVYDRERARDLMQECFMKTWEYITAGKEVKNLRAFLYRVANNLVIDSSRKKKERSLEEMAETGFDPSDNGHKQIVIDAESSHMKGLLERIEPHYRQVIEMRFIDGLSPSEIAEALGQTENAVSVRLHRGIKQLRAIAA
jgi:RNA polymerase sigma-70 factor (ECF subfamily)